MAFQFGQMNREQVVKYFKDRISRDSWNWAFDHERELYFYPNVDAGARERMMDGDTSKNFILYIGDDRWSFHLQPGESKFKGENWEAVEPMRRGETPEATLVYVWDKILYIVHTPPGASLHVGEGIVEPDAYPESVLVYLREALAAYGGGERVLIEIFPTILPNVIFKYLVFV